MTTPTEVHPTRTDPAHPAERGGSRRSGTAALGAALTAVIAAAMMLLPSTASAAPSSPTQSAVAQSAAGPSAQAPIRPAAAYTPNGCSNPLPFYATRNAQFRGVCNTHDYCYDFDGPARFPLLPPAGKGYCDGQFLAGMQNRCVQLYAPWSVDRAACLADAQIYFNAVAAFGLPFYNNKSLN